jgi:hypothetical protein
MFGNNSNKSKLIQDEIKKRFNSGNACFHSFQNLLSSRLCLETSKLEYTELTLTLREEHSVKVFENRVLGRIFGLKRDEVTGWVKLHN